MGPPAMRNPVIMGAILLALLPMGTTAQELSLTPDAQVGSIMRHVRAELGSLIADTETAYSGAAFETRVNAMVVLRNLELMTEGLLDKTFDELTDLQQEAFSEVEGLLDQWQTGTLELAGEFRGVATTLEDAISRAPLGDRSPLVADFAPGYYVLGETQLTVAVRGSRLGFGSPTLTLGGANCSRRTKTERLIEFACPPSSLSDDTETMDGELRVFSKRSFWDVVTFKKRERRYDVSLVRVPEILGTARVRAVVVSSQREEVDRTTRRQIRNSHCRRSPNSEEWTINAAAGWKIVPGSVSFRRRSANGASGPSLTSEGETGFRVRGSAENRGNCTWVLGQRVAVDARGWLDFDVTWREYRNVDVDGTVDVEGGVVQWGSDSSFQLPENAKGFTLTLETADGQTRIHTSPETSEWYDVGYARDSQTIVVKPKRVDQVFGR